MPEEINTIHKDAQRVSRGKALFINCSLFASVCFIFFIITEMVFRIFSPQSYDPYLFDPIIGSRKKPGTFVAVTDGETRRKYANSAGFIDDEWIVAKSAGVRRIAILGDSFLQAIQVDNEDDFESVLEKKLTASGTPTEALNFGIRGMGTTQEYLTLKHYALTYDPDLIIIAAFLFNDIEDNSLPLRSATIRPYIVFENGVERIVPPQDPTYKFPFSFFRDNFHTYRWFVNRYYDVRKVIAAKLRKNNNKYIQSDAVLPFFDIYSEQSQTSNEWKEAWHITKEMYRRIKAMADERDIPLLVVLIPTRYELYPDDWVSALEQRREQFPKAVDAPYNLSLPRKKGAEIFMELSIPYVDLYDELQKHASRGEKLYMPVDGHFNVHGHEVVADILREAVMKIHPWR